MTYLPRIEEFSKFPSFLDNIMSFPVKFVSKKNVSVKERFQALKEKLAKQASKNHTDNADQDQQHQTLKKETKTKTQLLKLAKPVINAPSSSNEDSPINTIKKGRKRKFVVESDSEDNKEAKITKEMPKPRSARQSLFKDTKMPSNPLSSQTPVPENTSLNEERPKTVAERMKRLCKKIQAEPPKVVKSAEVKSKKKKTKEPQIPMTTRNKTMNSSPISEFKIPKAPGRPRKSPTTPPVSSPKDKKTVASNNKSLLKASLNNTPTSPITQSSLLAECISPSNYSTPPPSCSAAPQLKFNTPPSPLLQTTLQEQSYTPPASQRYSPSPWVPSSTNLTPNNNNAVLPDSLCEAMDVESNDAHASEMCQEESMDWEVNELRKEIKDSANPSCLSHIMHNSAGNIAAQFILVLDSNVLISALPFVERILNTSLPELGFPVIYIPHRVLNELDGLKDCAARGVHICARKAVAFLNNMLLDKHPRIVMQSLKDYLLSCHDVYLNSDDKILLSCLQIKDAQQDGKRVILLSNDVNLRNKAIIESLDTFSVSEFEKMLMDMTEGVNVEELNFSLLGFKLRFLLKSVFEQILKVECRLNRQRLTLEECIQFFTRRWQPWFSRIVTVFAEESLLLLREALQSDEHVFFLRILEHGKKFLSCFNIRGKSYFMDVKKSLANLEEIKMHASTLVDLSPPDEKNYVGQLSEIFSECVDALEAELRKAVKAPTGGDQRFELLKDILKSIPSALEDILKEQILDVSDCAALPQLARILADNSSASEHEYFKLLKAAATRESGRDMLEKAQVMFSRALERCSQLQQNFAKHLNANQNVI